VSAIRNANQISPKARQAAEKVLTKGDVGKILPSEKWSDNSFSKFDVAPGYSAASQRPA
jgi:hypothetical protein